MSNDEIIWKIRDLTKEEQDFLIDYKIENYYSSCINNKNIKYSIKQLTHAYKNRSVSLINNESDVNGEMWRFYYNIERKKIDNRYLVSNLGRLKFKIDKIFYIVQQKYSTTYGVYVPDWEEFKKEHGFTDIVNGMCSSDKIHRFVGETWLECTGIDVHHINNNPEDNRIENLIWVDKIQHGQIEKNFES